MHPHHVEFVLHALGHGLRASSLDVAESTCRLLAGICAGLTTPRLSKDVAAWLADSSALADVAILLGERPTVQAHAATLVASCHRKSLLPRQNRERRRRIR